jgi:hypothetical protein
MSLLLQLTREFVRRCNVLGLTGFVAPGQKNHDFHAALCEIHAKAWAMVDAHFGHTFAHCLVVTEVAFLSAINTGLNAPGRLSVLQGLKPHIKDFGGVNRLHG